MATESHRPRAPDPRAGDVEKQEVRFGNRVIKATVPTAAQPARGGTWTPPRAAGSGRGIEATAGKLP